MALPAARRLLDAGARLRDVFEAAAAHQRGRVRTPAVAYRALGTAAG